jgi:hypothetical protein
MNHCALNLEHNGNAAIDFVTDLILYSGNHPSAKYDWDGDICVTGDHPCFIVVKSEKVKRNYARTIHTWRCGGVQVCADGWLSGSLFKAVTNTSLAHHLCSNDVKGRQYPSRV